MKRMVIAIAIVATVAIVATAIVIGYQNTLPSLPQQAENKDVAITIDGQKMSIYAKNDVEGYLEEFTLYYGLWDYLEWGDSKLLGTGSKRNFSLSKGENLTLEIFPENVNYSPVYCHGEYKVPTNIVQTFVVWTPNGKVAVAYKF